MPLESIYQNSNLISTLEKQLPANYLLKGLSTWNVKLDKTLNALPPCEHLNGLSKQIYAKENITTHSTVDEIHCVGNFVMTANHENASINIFSTQMGLNRTLQHNFYKQRHQPLDENKTKPLAHLKFKKILENPLARIMSRKG